MPSTTHPHAFHFDRPVDSYWEATADPLAVEAPALSGSQTCDVAIIGGGITGLSAAIELAGQQVDVRVLEAGHIGWGASGRNAGFAVVGSNKLSYGKMIRKYGLDETRRYFAAMTGAVDLVRDMINRHGIGAAYGGDGELNLAHRPGRMAELRDEQTFLRETFGQQTDLLTTADLKQQGAWSPAFHGALKSHIGLGIHPLNYVRGLARVASRSGATLHAASEVTRWQEGADGHLLETASGTLRARRVIVATNGYTPEDVSLRHAGRIIPALSSMLVTRPLTTEERATQGWTTAIPAFDTRILLHYFRLLPDGSFLFGSRGGTDASDGGAERYRALITREFHDMFPAWRSVAITHYWRGFVCLAHDLVPFVGALDDARTVWTALAYHGSGVAMGTWCGRAVARLMTGRAAREEVPSIITRRLARFPLPAFRPLYLKGAYLWYGWQDSR